MDWTYCIIYQDAGGGSAIGLGAFRSNAFTGNDDRRSKLCITAPCRPLVRPKTWLRPGPHITHSCDLCRGSHGGHKSCSELVVKCLKIQGIHLEKSKGLSSISSNGLLCRRRGTGQISIGHLISMNPMPIHHQGKKELTC